MGGEMDRDATPSRFGEFGGQYVPESLIDCLAELENGFNQAVTDPKFWEEYRSGQLHKAERLTGYTGGANIWLKREDLNHTGSYKINDALGQTLPAKRQGETEIITETGADQYGVATATVCAKFGMKCAANSQWEGERGQALNIFRITLFGAGVAAVETGSRTLRDAVNEALRTWVVRLDTTHYIVGDETKEQMQELREKLPDVRTYLS
ncbi:MAG: tryptophan synthetase [Trichoglossum hirsutum]|nr:MAG: tryptophan synthetase [Trichoglossum hirsutum]